MRNCPAAGALLWRRAGGLHCTADLHACARDRAGGYLHLTEMHLLLCAEARGHEYSHPHKVTYICIFHLVISKENQQKSFRLEGEWFRCLLCRASRSVNVSYLLCSLSPAHTHTGKCFCCEEMWHALPQMLLTVTWYPPTPSLLPSYRAATAPYSRISGKAFLRRPNLTIPTHSNEQHDDTGTCWAHLEMLPISPAWPRQCAPDTLSCSLPAKRAKHHHKRDRL